MPRVIVPLAEDEYEALLLVSQAEKRDPRDQMALWARRQLEQAGILAPMTTPAIQPLPVSNPGLLTRV